jgi:Na+-translocating ferredoxin:NAD+ oxidoreductase subunit G
MSDSPPTTPIVASASHHVAPRMYGALMSVGVVCSLLIAGVYELTRPVIAKNKEAALNAAVLKVLPGATRSVPIKLSADGALSLLPPTASSNSNAPTDTREQDQDATDGDVCYAAFDEHGKLLGVAVPAEGTGYQDVIRVLYGYSAERGTVVGFSVLESRETPGLGDKIASDHDFLRNFENLEVKVVDGKILHPIEAVKSGHKNAAWQVDGISGATISSQAVAHILRRSTGRWAPLINKHSKELVR